MPGHRLLIGHTCGWDQADVAVFIQLDDNLINDGIQISGGAVRRLGQHRERKNGATFPVGGPCQLVHREDCFRPVFLGFKT